MRYPFLFLFSLTGFNSSDKSNQWLCPQRYSPLTSLQSRLSLFIHRLQYNFGHCWDRVLPPPSCCCSCCFSSPAASPPLSTSSPSPILLLLSFPPRPYPLLLLLLLFLFLFLPPPPLSPPPFTAPLLFLVTEWKLAVLALGRSAVCLLHHLRSTSKLWDFLCPFFSFVIQLSRLLEGSLVSLPLFFFYFSHPVLSQDSREAWNAG